MNLIFDKLYVLTVNTQHFVWCEKLIIFTKFLFTCYLSLTVTRSTVDENPCKASSDFPAIFVASTPWAKASSHGTLPFGTVEVGAVNWNTYRSDENVTSFLTIQECHRWDLRGVWNYPTFLSQHFHRLICCYSEFTMNSDSRCRTFSNNDKHRLNFLTNVIIINGRLNRKTKWKNSLPIRIHVD